MSFHLRRPLEDGGCGEDQCSKEEADAVAVASRGWRRLALGGGYSVKEEEQDPDLVTPNLGEAGSGAP
uniref:DUF834 domain-containing protein n=1 Tax=Oryza barthii TaxID=65489 RepID=A0A0D3GVJ1_9ORYZ